MFKSIKRIALAVVVCCVFLCLLPGCSAKSPVDVNAVRAYADPMTEDVLLALSQGDYGSFCDSFNQKMKDAIPEDIFENLRDMVKEKIGDYTEKEFVQAEKQGQFTVVIYRAGFSLEPDDVIITISFEEVSGKEYVAGFYLNSPKLRAK
ncbi:MAG: DUF3887 domain-containing protein [Chloroflexota bacterium]